MDVFVEGSTRREGGKEGGRERGQRRGRSRWLEGGRKEGRREGGRTGLLTACIHAHQETGAGSECEDMTVEGEGERSVDPSLHSSLPTQGAWEGREGGREGGWVGGREGGGKKVIVCGGRRIVGFAFSPLVQTQRPPRPVTALPPSLPLSLPSLPPPHHRWRRGHRRRSPRPPHKASSHPPRGWAWQSPT